MKIAGGLDGGKILLRGDSSHYIFEIVAVSMRRLVYSGGKQTC